MLIDRKFYELKISTDIKTAVTNLTNQLVQQQKERLLTQGNSALSDFITKTKKPTDTTSGNSSHKGSC
jgi:hypothetical protein